MSTVEVTGARSLFACRSAEGVGNFDVGSAVGFDMTAVLGTARARM